MTHSTLRWRAARIALLLLILGLSLDALVDAMVELNGCRYPWLCPTNAESV